MISEKLNGRENEVMRAVYALSDGKERFLLFPCELAALLPAKGYDEEKVEGILRALELDGYFDLVFSERKGEKAYVIHMRAAGLAFKRADAQRRRGVCFRLFVAAAGAVVTFVIGMLLRLLFHGG